MEEGEAASARGYVLTAPFFLPLPLSWASLESEGRVLEEEEEAGEKLFQKCPVTPAKVVSLFSSGAGAAFPPPETYKPLQPHFTA